MNPGQADVEASRRRWRSAAESLFPSLMADPPSYTGALETIGAMATELGRRHADVDALVAAMADPEAFAVACGQRPVGFAPIDLLVGVACGMRERDIITETVRHAREAAITDARAAGDPWAVLNGPGAIEDVTGGASGVAGCTHLHLASGTELRATVDAWSPEPYGIDVVSAGAVPPVGLSFTARDPWIAEFRRRREEIGVLP